MLISDITILDETFTARSHCWVGVEGSTITYVGNAAPQDAARFGEVYCGASKVLMPGLVNAHAHAPMTLLRGYAENLPLQSWLNDKVFPFEALIDDDSALPATRLAIAEMLASGTTSFTDMYYFTDARATAVAESGIKANLSIAALGFDPTVAYSDMPISAQNEELIARWHGAEEGRILADLSIHAEYTSYPALVEAVGQVAYEKGLGTHIHLSETRGEHEECKLRHDGMTPAQYFESLGFFRTPCTAAHCVYAEEEDWHLFARHGVTAATNPASNCKLGSGVAPVPQMMAAGVQVALGTDGPASNNTHDLFGDMYLLALLHKGTQHDPTLMAPADVLRIATRNGALSQRRKDCGLIAPGMKADLVVLDFDKPHLQPATDILANVVYSARGADVVLTMVDGRVLYKQGEWLTIDVERAQAETTAATKRIIERL